MKKQAAVESESGGFFGEVVVYVQIFVVINEIKDLIDGVLEMRSDILAFDVFDEVFQHLDNSIHFIAGDFLEFLFRIRILFRI